MALLAAGLAGSPGSDASRAEGTRAAGGRRSAVALARVITGAINEAGLAIAHADDPKRVRVEYRAVIGALLEGLLRPRSTRGRREVPPQ